MSKTISIQESGLGTTETVDALRLSMMEGGTKDLIPTDSVGLVKITVKQNGTYKASDFGAYGISEVRVACTLNGGSATSAADSREVGGSFNPSVSVGGVPHVFTAKRVETPLDGGGSCQWLCKGDVALGTKSINVDNTTYKAVDDGYYGYSQVTVSGISITKTTDQDGNEVIEHTDGTGTETQVVPSSIAVDTPPTFVGPYNDGMDISFDGMVVKAYKGDGTIWTDASHPNGVIPTGELTLPVTKAQGGAGYREQWTDGHGVNAMLISYTQRWWLDWNDREVTGYMSQEIGTHSSYPAMFGNRVGPTQFFATRYNGLLYVFGSTADRHLNGYEKKDGAYSLFSGTSFTSGTGEVKITDLGYEWATAIPTSTVEPTGTEDLYPITVPQTIPVQWTRPGDNGVLETSFDVSVA